MDPQLGVQYANALQHVEFVSSVSFGSALMRLAFQRLDDDGNTDQPLPRSKVLRLLQDICSISHLLPTKYWLSDVEVNTERISMGGEAMIFSGNYQGRAVAVREIFPPQDEDWTSPKGMETLNVSIPSWRYMWSDPDPLFAVRQIIRREVIIHGQLHHQNLLPLFGVYQSTRSIAPLIILPYVRNGSAINWLQKNGSADAFFKIVRPQ